RDAAFVLHRGHEPGPVWIVRVNRDGETEFRGPDRGDLLPRFRPVGRSEDAVVVLNPKGIRPSLAMHQAMRILDRRVFAPVGGHEFGVHALRGRMPGEALILALPYAPAGDGQSHVASVARIEADRVDTRSIVSATEPTLAIGMVPQAFEQAPT